MFRVHRCEPPPGALLLRLAEAGAYTDGWVTEGRGALSHAAFVEAFYTSPLFKLERRLLGWFAALPSTDLGARALARGEADRFAAWQVEARSGDQLLVAAGRTRSWLMVVPVPDAAAARTRLYFGSAVLPRRASQGRRGLGLAFHLLLGLHKFYSQALLASARSRCEAGLPAQRQA